ncbi:hypothetical protein QJS10_CPA05g02383 [Acorus calamus]|uniref:AAA+ ATPase domain-containing protein n=1 Tax=Acorus calamus TaxID=4465 RepID=A0AAV9EYG4_ACOCL|nr:hypothetical protein QJS10_CPA05g02383 [Acorus calamus]
MEMLDWKSIGSLLATLLFLRSAIRDILPPQLHHYLNLIFSHLLSAVHPNVSILIEEFDSSYNNELFDAAQSYLSSRCFSSASVIRLSKPKNSRNLTFSMDANQKLIDSFNGVTVRWTFRCIERKSGSGYAGFVRSQDHRFFELSFHRKHKDVIHKDYLPHVMEQAELIKLKNRERRLYTNRSAEDDGRLWSAVPFNHPSTFDAIAIDPSLKEDIKADLTKFVNRREYYSRVGRAWKRGYLLYGPPGTGKTSLIAAIANFLEFDVYDLELTAVTSNSQLRKLLISTSSKSVIVVEDIDCTLDLSERKKSSAEEEAENPPPPPQEEERNNRRGRRRQSGLSGSYSTVSLSGVLNFVDGLWSSCGGERLIVFTTNHVEKLDPALLRPGRMDRKIHLSFCEVEAFKALARNYLCVACEEGEEGLMREVEELLPKAKMTPADVAEVFMGCDDDAEMGMRKVVEEMKRRVGVCEMEALIKTECV